MDEKEQKSVYFSATIFEASKKKLEIDNQKKGIDGRFEKYQGRRIRGYMWEMI